MKLSISNIAWNKENDEEMYRYISESGYNAIEIASTRIIEENPYSNIDLAIDFAVKLKQKYNLKICSMQSIWYGRNEKIFLSLKDREEMINYTKKAIDFASSINCKNLVFGCPKNRVIDNIDKYDKIIIDFFCEIGNYAKIKNCIFSIEPNPVIYNTNFINTTKEAVDIVKVINNDGVKINLDLGTIIYNEEDINIIESNIDLINHVHISEPNLEYVTERDVHKKILKMLKYNGYNGYISIEMKNQNNIEKVKETINYLKKIYKEI